jgi:hypothetical protein
MFYAARFAKEDVVKYLVERGANANARNEQGTLLDEIRSWEEDVTGLRPFWRSMRMSLES